MSTYTLFSFFFFFFNDTATTEIYTLSLHDALPISTSSTRQFLASSSRKSVLIWPRKPSDLQSCAAGIPKTAAMGSPTRSEEHTSELQSQSNLVCRLLLEKKKKKKKQRQLH